MSKVSLETSDVRQVLEALVSEQPHHIRELQAIRVPYIDNPIDRLVAEYNSAVQKSASHVRSREVLFEDRSHSRGPETSIRLMREDGQFILEFNARDRSDQVALSPDMSAALAESLVALKDRGAPSESTRAMILPVAVRREVYGEPYEEVTMIYLRRDEERMAVEIPKWSAAKLAKLLEAPPAPASPAMDITDSPRLA